MKNIISYWDNYWEGLRQDWIKDGSTLGWFIARKAKRDNAFPDITKFALKGSIYGKRVLEIGCGLGCNSVDITIAGANLTAMDVSKVACELTSEHLALRGLTGEVLNLNAEVLPFENNTFDIVYSWGVFMHSENPQAIINEVYRVLKPNGELRTMIYNRVSLGGLFVYYLAVKRTHNPFISLKQAFSVSESPSTKAYTKRELLRMFKMFGKISITPTFMAEVELIRNSPKLQLFEIFLDDAPGWMASYYLIEAVKIR